MAIEEEYYCCACGYRGNELGPEDEDGYDTCPKCGADQWWFTDVETHGALQDEREEV